MRALESGDSCLPSITIKGIRRRQEAAGAAAAATPRSLSIADRDLGSSPRRAASGSISLREGATLGSRPVSGRPSSAGSGASGSSGASRVSAATGISGVSSGNGRRRSTATHSDYSTVSRRTDASSAAPPLAGRSLWLLPEDSLLRLTLYDFVTSKRFEYAMFALILLNCVAMAYEYPHMRKGALDTAVLHWADVAFTAIFGVEAALKILAFTFRGYIASATNKVDLLIVAISVLLLALDVAEIQAIKALRVLRAAKPLRALTRSAGMRLVFK